MESPVACSEIAGSAVYTVNVALAEFSDMSILDVARALTTLARDTAWEGAKPRRVDIYVPRFPAPLADIYGDVAPHIARFRKEFPRFAINVYISDNAFVRQQGMFYRLQIKYYALRLGVNAVVLNPS